MALGIGAIAELPIASFENRSLSAVSVAGVFCTGVVTNQNLETDQDRRVYPVGVAATGVTINGASSDQSDLGTFLVVECESNITLVPSVATASFSSANPPFQFILGSGYLLVGVSTTGILNSVSYEEDRRLYILGVQGQALSGALFTYSGLGAGTAPTYNLNTPTTPGLYTEIEPSTSANYNPV